MVFPLLPGGVPDSVQLVNINTISLASPLAALCMERFYPEPIRISRAMVAAIVTLGLLPFF